MKTILLLLLAVNLSGFSQINFSHAYTFQMDDKDSIKEVKDTDEPITGTITFTVSADSLSGFFEIVYNDEDSSNFRYDVTSYYTTSRSHIYYTKDREGKIVIEKSTNNTKVYYDPNELEYTRGAIYIADD